MDLDFKISGAMISSTGEAEKQVYTKHKGKGGNVWYLCQGDRRADNVYVSTKNKEGMGGRNTNMQMADGTVDVVAGLWCSNAGALLEETGIDITNEYSVDYVIAKEVKHSEAPYGPIKFIDVIENSTGLASSFDHPEERCQKLADELGVKLYVGVRTAGGGRCTWRDPEGENN